MAFDVQQILKEADARNGFPAGTMASVMQQESGGNSKFIDDPTAYHYEMDANGQRIAGHTGKVSTAFGPFGLLESTAKDPGYGVTPLQSKDLKEQARFASDYLAARTKAGGGSLSAGLAGYGEGPKSKYAQQVMARIGGPSPAQAAQVTPVPSPMQAPAEPPVVEVAQAPVEAPIPPAKDQVVAQAQAPQVDPWQEFMQQLRGTGAKPVDVADLSGYGSGFQLPSFQVAPVSNRPVNFNSFGKWGARV